MHISNALRLGGPIFADSEIIFDFCMLLQNHYFIFPLFDNKILMKIGVTMDRKLRT